MVGVTSLFHSKPPGQPRGRRRAPRGGKDLMNVTFRSGFTDEQRERLLTYGADVDGLPVEEYAVARKRHARDKILSGNFE
jgi:hypothetical protein